MINLKYVQPEWNMLGNSETTAKAVWMTFAKIERLSSGILYALIVKLLATSHALNTNTDGCNPFIDLLWPKSRISCREVF